MWWHQGSSPSFEIVKSVVGEMLKPLQLCIWERRFAVLEEQLLADCVRIAFPALSLFKPPICRSFHVHEGRAQSSGSVPAPRGQLTTPLWDPLQSLFRAAAGLWRRYSGPEAENFFRFALLPTNPEKCQWAASIWKYFLSMQISPGL